MNETVRSLIEAVTVRYPQPTPISGGHVTQEFFDCARLSPNDLARLAAQAVGHLPEHAFDAVVGIAYAGILFAAAVGGGQQVVILQKDGTLFGPSIQGQRVVLVDDVVATGRRVSEAARLVEAAGAKIVGYACIVDRSGGKFGGPDTPLWSAHQAEI